MPINKRASIFAPFSALTGFSDKIKMLEIHKDIKREIDIDKRDDLDLKMKTLLENNALKEEIIICYYDSSLNKYLSIISSIKKIDNIKREIILSDKKCISFDDIIDINKKEV